MESLSNNNLYSANSTTQKYFEIKDTDFTNWEITGIPLAWFAQNRQNFVKNIKLRYAELEENALLILKGGDEIPRFDTDVLNYHFFQESNFYYLTGIREPAMRAVMDLNSGEIIAFTAILPETNKIWMKVQTLEELKKRYGFEFIDENKINELIISKRPEKIYLLQGNNEYSSLPVIYPALDFKEEFADLNSKISTTSKIYEILCDTRSVKTNEEYNLLKFINKITNDAHKEIMKHINFGLYERDFENVFMNYLSKNYYTRIWAYPCIGGCGCNSATLHYDKNDVLVKEGDLYLADMGIRFCNYTSDVTQTIPVTGKFSKRQKEIYDIVLKSNREVIKMMKPNVTTYSEMDKTSRIVILQELQKLGLINQGFSVEEMLEKKVDRVFMPHGLGHFVGLDVHDVGQKVSYKSQRIIEPGNLITVEPGIYFIPFLLENSIAKEELKPILNQDLIRTYFDFGGIRIEDDIFALEDTVENFNEDLPRTTEEIETYIKENNIFNKTKF
jgi:Xaa-Pro dipeptidase